MKALNKLGIFIGLLLIVSSLALPGLAVPGIYAVSGLFNPKFTFSDTEVMDFSELIYEDVFEKAPLTEYFTFMEGIKSGSKIGIVGQMSAIGTPRGACDTTERLDAEIATIEKAWAPCSWGDRIPFCAADLEDQFIVWGLNNGIRRPDLTNTDYADFIMDVVADAMLESLYRIIFFGDTAADDQAGGGELVNGTEVELFQCHDGFWKQAFAIVAADSDRKSVTGLTAKNAEATFADQAFDDTDTDNLVVTNALRAVIHGSTLKARSKTDRFIIVTQSVADQYSVELESATGIEAAWVMQQDGIATIRRMGVMIVTIPKQDDIIRTFINDGTKSFLPHRIAMYAKNNVAIGVEDSGSIKEMEMFYDKTEKKNFVDFLAKLDTKILEDIHMQFAY